MDQTTQSETDKQPSVVVASFAAAAVPTPVAEPAKTFYELLNELADTEVFELELTDGKLHKFKQLNANNLKDLIKTIVDSPLTQAEFNSTVSQIMEECATPTQKAVSFNVIDRLLFIIESRIQAISSKAVSIREDSSVEIDLSSIKNKLTQKIKENTSLFSSKELNAGGLKVICEIPSIKTDSQLNKEMYKNLDIDVDNPDDLRKILGESFINEIAKSIRSVSIQNTSIDFSSSSFEDRLKTVGSLPAVAINSVIDYIEDYKKIVDGCLTVDGQQITVDGSLFSVR